ncbi:hypothetical protein [Paenibacillus cymbidii]|uniref:hypothetical protein n=1 Tax=Paenibacillus cymbidii TaxID=1639034 RepID=UPI001081FD9C|nr:hypothetical protein [Paenibacillus cymbidii]
MRFRAVKQLVIASMLAYTFAGATGAAVAADPVPTEAPLASDITVVNYPTGTDDTVTVTGLQDGDLVNVYKSADGAELWGSATAVGTQAIVSITQLGRAAGGTLYVTVTSSGDYSESERTAKEFTAEGISAAISATNITIDNNIEEEWDYVHVAGLDDGDTVKVYSTQTSIYPIASLTITDSTYAHIPLYLSKAAGSVYVSLTSPVKLEGARTAKSFAAESISTAPVAGNITIDNNLRGTSDKVTVTGLTEGTVVKIYANSTDTVPLAAATVAAGETDIEVSITQIGQTAGSLYVTLTNAPKTESPRTAKSFSAEPTTAAPLASAITVENNREGTADTITVTGLVYGAVVTVYNAAASAVAIGKATVADDETSVVLSVAQLGKGKGSILVSQTEANKLESAKTAKAYVAEQVSAALTAASIAVVNRVEAELDTVTVDGLSEGDIIKVYETKSSTAVLGQAEVGEDQTSAAVSLYLSNKAGSVYTTVTKQGKLESPRTAKAYAAEETTPALTADRVTVTNHAEGTADEIVVTGLSAGEIVRVYSTAKGAFPLGGTVAEGSTATVKVQQLGVKSGKVFVSVTADPKAESTRIEKTYTAEQTSASVSATATNEAEGTADTIAVSGLAPGDIVTVYPSKSSLRVMGTAEASGTTATIAIEQLGKKAGTVYVAVTSGDKRPSARTAVSYTAEATVAVDKNAVQSTTLSASAIAVTNGTANQADQVTVSGLAAGDVVKVYEGATSGWVMGSATESGGTASVSIAQLGSAKGKIYVSVTSTDKLESKRTAAAYAAEPVTAVPVTASVYTVNNPGGSLDKVAVSNVTVGDAVYVFASSSAAASPLAWASVTSGTTVEVPVFFSKTAATVYVSVQNENKLPSKRLKVKVAAELASGVADSAIAVANRPTGTMDTVTVNGLETGDLVKVYATSKAPVPLAGAVVTTGDSVTISVYQLGKSAGKVYVSVTASGKSESGRTVKAFAAEPVTATPVAAAVTVTNNVYGIADHVTVSGLTDGDRVNVYTTNTTTTAIGSATASGGSADVSIEQLGKANGTVYVAVTGTDKLESKRLKKTYIAEATAAKPTLANISIDNNSEGTLDRIVVSGLAAGDTVKVYATSKSVDPIASGTESSGTATLYAYLAKAGGTAYVTVTGTTSQESARVGKIYGAEQTSTAPAAEAMAVDTIAKTITVNGLTAGDAIKIYANSSDKMPIGGAVAAGTSATATLAQLGTSGKVYVTVTSPGKPESKRTERSYKAT